MDQECCNDRAEVYCSKTPGFLIKCDEQASLNKTENDGDHSAIWGKVESALRMGKGRSGNAKALHHTSLLPPLLAGYGSTSRNIKHAAAVDIGKSVRVYMIELGGRKGDAAIGAVVVVVAVVVAVVAVAGHLAGHRGGLVVVVAGRGACPR